MYLPRPNNWLKPLECGPVVNGRLTAQQESYQQLEQTWKMANQHFIVAQDKLRQQMYFLQQKQSLLQPPQPLPQGSPHGLDV